MSTAAQPRASGVGELIRTWRRRRNLSQLELSLDSAISARHLSFVETGRANPSREMVLHLCERLEIPLRERNSLLLAAGFAPLYPERALDHEEMAPIRGALEHFLRAHEPYPAVVVDGHWNLISANDALDVLVDGVAPDLLTPPANGLRITLHPQGMAPRILNFAQWSSHMIRRLRRRAAITADLELERLYDEVKLYPDVALEAPAGESEASEVVLPLRIRHSKGDLAFLSTISTFGSAHDITLAELSVEAFYPANAATAKVLFDSIDSG
ncbi:MAG TPA: helix-turn-helix transcriptional regulator [Solirubrobacteraceae bacterium]|nr:helix-turn-helix transcriptional regulator [Solirubrobacteraceae bacterium]